MTPDEVRMLDNRYAILFIRGERPILDEKFDILKHPNVGLTTDGNGKPYLHGAVDRAVASISLGDSLEGEFTDDSLEVEDFELLSDEDLEEISQLGRNRLNVTIGSALDLFGGPMSYEQVLTYISKCNAEKEKSI